MSKRSMEVAIAPSSSDAAGVPSSSQTPGLSPEGGSVHPSQYVRIHVNPKAHTTISIYTYIINSFLLPRWGKSIAVNIEPLDVERWLQSVKRDKGLANPTLDKLKRVMSLVYKSAQRFGLINRGEEANPIRFVRCKTRSGYEAKTVTAASTMATIAIPISVNKINLRLSTTSPIARAGKARMKNGSGLAV